MSHTTLDTLKWLAKWHSLGNCLLLVYVSMNFFETASFGNLLQGFWRQYIAIVKFEVAIERLLLLKRLHAYARVHHDLRKLIKDKFMSCLTFYAVLDAENKVPLKL